MYIPTPSTSVGSLPLSEYSIATRAPPVRFDEQWLPLERVVLRRHFPDPVVANDGDFRQDILPHSRDLAEEEKSEDASRDTEPGCNVAVSEGFDGGDTHQVRDVFGPVTIAQVRPDLGTRTERTASSEKRENWCLDILGSIR